MAFLRITLLAALAVIASASPIEVSQSYSQSNSGQSSSHGGGAVLSYSHEPAVSYSYAPAVSYSHAPLVSYSHAPAVSYSHAPLVSYSHAPVVSVSHAPVAVKHVPVEVEHYAPAHYEFKYGVKDEHTHDIKEQAEKRVGDKVEGYYKLLEADGTTRTVHYTADKHTGFNAVVTRSGHAQHPSAPVKVAVPVHKVVVPVQKVISAPVLSYAHAAPSVSYSTNLNHGYSGGSLGGYH